MNELGRQGIEHKLGMIAASAAVALIVGTLYTSGLKADEQDDEDKVERGLAIAPVPLNLIGKDRQLVGLGSYIVNGQIDCNGCHSMGPQTEFTPSGNPYLLPPIFNGKKQINPATYLGGGRDFGPLGPPANPGSHIMSRNLTPDKTGLPEGGRPFSEFLQIIRTGIDLDKQHAATCSLNVTTNCVPFPFDGTKLQIMPWPAFQNMTDHDLQAIYEYLSAIPCIEGPTDPTNPLHNDCP
jgi:hypothetical protein